MQETSLHLVVQLYKPESQDRYQRLCDSILQNAELAFIDRITVVSEMEEAKLNHEKIKFKAFDHPASFGELMRIALCREAKTTHAAIANTDILLTDDIDSLMDRLTKPSSVAAITRRELSGDHYPNPKCSQDLWLFKAHHPSEAVMQAANAQLGIAGCENLFAMSLYIHGYDIWNPCLSCSITHNDPEPNFSYSHRLLGSYLNLLPCKQEDIESSEPSYETVLCRQEFEPQKYSPNGVISSQVKGKPGGKIKLHFCCGDKKIPEFLGVDIRADVRPDIIASLEHLESFEDKCADEIYFCHGLEHIALKNAKICLLGLKRILRPAGILRLALPDFEALSRLYVAGFSPLSDIRLAIHGAQDHPHNIHYMSWDFQSLAKLLSECGFCEITRYAAKDFLPEGYFDWSLHHIHGVPISLNIQCIRQSDAHD